jgi:hypothetical protein
MTSCMNPGLVALHTKATRQKPRSLFSNHRRNLLPKQIRVPPTNSIFFLVFISMTFLYTTLCWISPHKLNLPLSHVFPSAVFPLLFPCMSLWIHTKSSSYKTLLIPTGGLFLTSDSSFKVLLCVVPCGLFTLDVKHYDAHVRTADTICNPP